MVYGLYPDVRDEQAKLASQSSGILWADQGGDFHGRKILMLADRTPADCIEGVQGSHGQVRSKPVGDGFLDHGRYRFKVVVNPTMRESATGKLRPIKGREAVVAWFAERSESSWGFQISPAHLQVERIEVLQFKDKAQRPVTLAQAHVQGHLCVTDPTQFQKSFAHGIGRGRSFGCGLLQIVPLIDNSFA